MPAQQPLVEVSEIAREAGYDVSSGQLHGYRVHSADLPLPIYFTGRLAQALGGPEAPGFRAGALRLLRAVHAEVDERIIAGTSWRAQVSYPISGGAQTIWVILGHAHSDGLAFGFGPGDFW